MFPLELITGLGSFILGAVFKLMKMRMDMKHQEQQSILASAGIVREAREYGKKDEWFSWTRRVIALTLLATVTAPIWAPFIGDLLAIPIAVAIPAADTVKTSFLWGLFSYTDTVESYQHITTMTYLPEYKHYFWGVMGLYFGAKK